MSFDFGLGTLGLVPSDLEKQFSDVTLINSWKLRGRIDVAEQNASSQVRILDYKTGVCPDPAPIVTGGGEVLQPLLYALAAEQLYRTKFPLEGSFSTRRCEEDTACSTLH